MSKISFVIFLFKSNLIFKSKRPRLRQKNSKAGVLKTKVESVFLPSSNDATILNDGRYNVKMGKGQSEDGWGWRGLSQGQNDEETLRRTDRNEIPGSIPSGGVLLLTHTVRGPRSILLTWLLAYSHTQTHTLWHFIRQRRATHFSSLEAAPRVPRGPQRLWINF